ncbi:MAG: hypothetical protein ACJ780_07435 [Solirubrobacteraceae bacterium]
MHHVPRRILKRVVPFALCLVGVFGAATSAQAAAPVPFTITQTVTGLSPTGGGMGTFVATAPLCPSGTWLDTVHNTAPNSPNNDAHSDRFNLLVRTTFDCDDGRGSFFVQSQVDFTVTDGVVSNTGPSLLHGGTGAFLDLQGHGVDTQGIMSGFITQP